MTSKEILQQLKTYGTEQTKKVLKKHGAKEPLYGVKVQDLKKIKKKIKKDNELALELYETGNSDAMYLAGLISEPQKMTKNQLQNWAKKAYWYYLSEYTVAWTAAESKYGWELALEWINADEENIASSGWATLSSLIAIKDDSEINHELIDKLLTFVQDNIHQSKNRVKYAMNGFVIASGSYLKQLNTKSKQIAKTIGKVKVEMGGTACKVPLPLDYIEKIEVKNKIGIKRKTSFC